MNRKDLRTAAALLGALICLPACLAATTLVRMSLAQLAGAADTVVRVRCLATATRWQQGAVWTFADFERLETFKGSPPRRIRVQFPGGRVGHIVATVGDVPEFRPGQQAVLFLEKTASDTYVVTAWAEGTFRIRRHGPAGADTVTQASSAFAVFDPRTHRFRTGGIRNLPLPDFRRRLAVALATSSSAGRP